MWGGLSDRSRLLADFYVPRAKRLESLPHAQKQTTESLKIV